jgi:hypothetical protein
VGPCDGANAGGIRRGEQSIAAHAAPIEADLRRYHRIDLRDLYRPGGGQSRLTYRLLGVLLDHLPGESAYKTAIRDALTDDDLTQIAKEPRRGHGPWSSTDLLLASAIDHLKWVIYAVYAAQGGKPKQPDPLPRPGVATKRRALSPEGRAYLQRLRDNQGAAAPPPAPVGAEETG